MGRKAKLKHQRHQPQTPKPQPESVPLDTTDFVQDLQQQGYQFKESVTAPEIPQDQIKPQL
ncbi:MULTISPECIES: hypothetical protein [unclassified Roseofilum]|uniref:hypothetical protein n=1 Tax=unclassified Roseofilum TaxID=2620099 RepID=UPI000E8185E0|nr:MULTISPECIES: hypothetical protein [unclassified Roseofilum]HBQ99128.1 hypothetical protein [Cyanobacteria bacterium UBA11691]MBP0010808.1 hypothetical protein [Roseofilum sp. Belize Diploria]MBP0013969.1 hypothetical protein [Roseofilum sp. SID3]MBP0026367.1 hypothetical protein [Roseofilum sp. SID2]MBP0031242.1 hypothetical protein [Roseofilum sp. Guam]